MADLLQISVFSEIENTDPDQFIVRQESPLMPKVTLYMEDIIEAIDTLSFNAASGPLQISNSLSTATFMEKLSKAWNNTTSFKN